MTNDQARGRIGVLGLFLSFAAACSSSSPAKTGTGGGAGGTAGARGGAGAGTAGANAGSGGGTAGSGGATAGAGGATGGSGGGTGSQTVGTSGGTVSMNGVTLTIPSGALTADTAISVMTIMAPASYTLVSAGYQFGPTGTAFAKPVTVTIPLTTAAPGAHLFWSNTTGGYDDLGGTVNGTTLTGSVLHFSVGFAAIPGAATDGGAGDAPTDGAHPDTPADTSASDGGAQSDAGASDGSASDGGASSDAGASDGSASDGGTSSDAGASDSGVAMCTSSFAVSGANVTPQLINDSVKPGSADFSGGTLESGTYVLTGVVHHGSQYGGATQETLVIDVIAKTMVIGDGNPLPGYRAYNISFPASNIVGGSLSCCSFPAYPAYCTSVAQVPEYGWYYTFTGTGTGAQLSSSGMGSSDVQTYTKQ